MGQRITTNYEADFFWTVKDYMIQKFCAGGRRGELDGEGVMRGQKRMR